MCGCATIPPPVFANGTYQDPGHEYSLQLPPGWEPIKAVPEQFLARRTLTGKYNWIVGERVDSAFLRTDTKSVIAIRNITTVGATEGRLPELARILRKRLQSTERAIAEMPDITGYMYRVYPSENGAGPVRPLGRLTYRMVNNATTCQCELRLVTIRISRDRLHVLELQLLSDVDWFQDNMTEFEAILRSVQPLELRSPPGH